LVSSKTNVMLTKKGISEMEVYDPAKVKERYGILPEAVAEMKGLMGDKSDNIPGVPGIGEKTAAKLVKEFGTVDNLLNNIDKLKGKLRENLEKYSEQAKSVNTWPPLSEICLWNLTLMKLFTGNRIMIN